MKLINTIVILMITIMMIAEANQLKDTEPRVSNPCTMTSTGLECEITTSYDYISDDEAINMCEELSLTYDYEAEGDHPMDFCK